MSNHHKEYITHNSNNDDDDVDAADDGKRGEPMLKTNAKQTQTINAFFCPLFC